MTEADQPAQMSLPEIAALAAKDREELLTLMREEFGEKLGEGGPFRRYQRGFEDALNLASQRWAARARSPK
jgi:hypothetical protein